MAPSQNRRDSDLHGPRRRVWGQDNSGGSGLVRAIVKRLRRKLGAAAYPACIFNRRRTGYWMERAEDPEPASP